MAKITRTEQMMREIMSKGSEPDFAGLNHNDANFASRYAAALNWIHQTVEVEQLKKELETLLRATNREDRIPELDSISAPVMHTMGKVAYCINRGAELSERSYAYISRGLAERAPAPSLSAAPVEQNTFEMLPVTPAGRINDDYKACYSRLDNLRALFCAGKRDIKQVAEETRKIVAAYGTRPGVHKRLVEHYTQSVNEAAADVSLKTWVKPLRAILKTLDANAVTAKPAAAPKKELAEKVAKVLPKTASTKKQRAEKPAKKVAKPAAAPKKAAKAAPKQKVQAGDRKPSFASQVRELIMDARRQDKTQADVIEMAVIKLNMNRSSARNCVLFNWERM